MLASGMMPRGVGDTKLKALFQLKADPRTWSTLSSCEGWSKDALQSFLQTMSAYETWRTKDLPAIPYPRIVQQAPLALGVDSPNPAAPRGIVCLTGFRDAEFQKQMEAKGFTFANTVSKKTTHLIVKTTSEQSEKTKKAAEMGIRILTREDAQAEYLGTH
jgi:NAD-dependent DNA ligase